LARWPARSRKDTEELGTVVEINGSIKIKVTWDGGRTSYFRHGNPGNTQLKQPLTEKAPQFELGIWRGR